MSALGGEAVFPDWWLLRYGAIQDLWYSSPVKKLSLGLSLIEVIMAIAILAIATLGVLAALTRVMIAQSSSSHQTLARVIGDSALREAILAGPPNWGNDPTETVQSRFARVGQESNEVKFFFETTPKLVSGDEIFEAGPDMGQLWQVSVRVWWDSEDGETAAVERGSRTLTLHRMVFLER